MKNEEDTRLAEFAHIFHGPLAAIRAAAGLAMRSHEEQSHAHSLPALLAILERNATTLQSRIAELLERAEVERKSVVLRLDQSELTRILAIGRSDDEENGSRPSDAPELVLVVEDDRDLRTMVSASLRGEGYRVLETDDGDEAMILTGQYRPQILLVDALLPGRNGFELCSGVRKMDPAYKPRIMIMSAVYKKISYRLDALEKFGANDYITKPFAISDLLERVAKLGDSPPNPMSR